MERSSLDIDSRYPLESKFVDDFRRDGFVKLDAVLGAGVLKYYGESIQERVVALNPIGVPMGQRDTYQRAFIQVTNLWRKSEAVRSFVLGQRLGRIAAELMGTKGVRIYHDQALFKESRGGHTPWHADQYYWPLATDRCVTAWIPLQATPVEMGALAFATGSHHHEIGRDIAISDESEARLDGIVEGAGFAYACAPYALGDVSFHSGWTFHRAGPNTTGETRRVMTIIYMDRDMRLAAPQNGNQVLDREAFCPGIADGEIIASEVNPIVWQEKQP
jgi:ectoine hydroxylase-related dioxygenase (phytanoyl-CoA dioxygenase family)